MSQAQLSRPRRGGQLLILLPLFLSTVSYGENVILKNGILYRGIVDKDNTIVYIDDGLRRVVVRDSKIARMEPDTTFGHWETFRLEQPLVRHTGIMPKDAFAIKTGPWSPLARRTFEYRTARSKNPIRMEQAIFELGPYMVRVRGIDGFWQDGRLRLSQVPKEVVLGLLSGVNRTSLDERRRVASFLIQAEWYKEAKHELDEILHDFPDDAGLRDTIGSAKTVVHGLEATQLLEEIEVRRKARQYREVRSRLKTFPTDEGGNSEALDNVRGQIQNDEKQANEDEELARLLLELFESLPSDLKPDWKKPINEMLLALKEAPDVVRTRFSAWRKVSSEEGSTEIDNASRFALAASGYLLGEDAAVTDLEKVKGLWALRGGLRDYLTSEDSASRSSSLQQLQSAVLPDLPGQITSTARLETLTRIVSRMLPPLHSDRGPKPGEAMLHRVQSDEITPAPEYKVLLPPEYHPLRTYPTLVALHNGEGPGAAIDWWSSEAARRGYIVIAPEYRLPDQGPDYAYTPNEHALVELAIRDARRRYAVDDDRLYLAGQLGGADMAWDFGAAHPDLFAGVAVISGRPFKYTFRYHPNIKLVPLYVALGGLAPAGPELVFQSLLRPMIARTDDVTYVEYYHRGLEDLPEEIPAVFDWMDHHRRENPFPKSFDAVTARESDNRFFGVVLQDFVEGRTMAPEAVEPLGKNLKPATVKLTSSRLSNLVNVQTSGIKSLDVWIGPKQLDFQKKIKVRINGEELNRPVTEPNLEPFLEDLRIRGDRQQVYWLKASWRNQ